MNVNTSTESKPPIYGNYKAYYTRRTAHFRGSDSRDPRLKLLTPEQFNNKYILDIGCNSGQLTVDIAQNLHPKLIVGVDIDDVLVKLAHNHLRLVWSRQEPLPHLIEYQNENEQETSLSKQARPQISENLKTDHFPLSMPRMFGFLPIPPVSLMTTEYANEYENDNGEQVKKHSINPDKVNYDQGVPSTYKRQKRRRVQAFSEDTDSIKNTIQVNTRLIFPHNVAFQTADWVKKDIPQDFDGYDVILAFSVTKWIHLNSLDKGIRRLFEKAYSCLNEGGRFIVEPQEWSSYSRAKRYSPILAKNYQKLKLRPTDFGDIAMQVGFTKVEELGTVGSGGFNRRVDVYIK